MNIPVSIEGLPEDVIRELVTGRHMAEVKEAAGAKERQAAINAVMGEHRSMDGLGRPTLAIDPFIYHSWAAKFGTNDCWKDKGFRRYMTRNHESMRVRGGGGTRIQVGWSPANKKFSKSYGQNE